MVVLIHTISNCLISLLQVLVLLVTLLNFLDVCVSMCAALQNDAVVDPALTSVL